MKKIQKAFFSRDALVVAKELLGKVISYNNCSGIIVETEAYKKDPASHAFKITPRSEIMLNSYGKFYIYFIYGMYHCLNITTNKNDIGAVLIRSLQPLDGISIMKKRRKTSDIHNLLSGPGKLCQALNITKSLNNTNVDDKIKVYYYKNIKNSEIEKTKRIGIKESKDLDWRFYIKNNKFVSK
ncbi:MAG: DNA-3-methyladenine glycosylase [Candidatus Woesearchaeota archaeon]|nr:MAG: DNA-3-methyladenine glycosylase [Candidatus Woesearchaeota archaeon]